MTTLTRLCVHLRFGGGARRGSPEPLLSGSGAGMRDGAAVRTLAAETRAVAAGEAP